MITKELCPQQLYEPANKRLSKLKLQTSATFKFTVKFKEYENYLDKIKNIRADRKDLS